MFFFSLPIHSICRLVVAVYTHFVSCIVNRPIDCSEYGSHLQLYCSFVVVTHPHGNRQIESVVRVESHQHLMCVCQSMLFAVVKHFTVVTEFSLDNLPTAPEKGLRISNTHQHPKPNNIPICVYVCALCAGFLFEFEIITEIDRNVHTSLSCRVCVCACEPCLLLCVLNFHCRLFVVTSV